MANSGLVAVAVAFAQCPPGLQLLRAQPLADRDLDQRVEDGLVLWQRDGALDAALRRTAAAWPRPDPQWIEDRFWVWVHYGATKLGRGELFECLDMLAAMRAMVFGPLIADARGGGDGDPLGITAVSRA